MKTSVAALLAGVLVSASPLHAQTDTDAEIAALRAEIERLHERLDALEQRRHETVDDTRVADAPAAPPRSAPSDGMRLSADLRYRHETIDAESAAQRNRHRFRARLGLDADVADDVSLGLRLATGADNPVSANQSFDGGFTRKSIGVDRAFFAWRFNERAELRGGKMGNPMFRPGGHALIFDSDLNPEGLALRYEGDALFANVAGLWVEERGAGDDSILMAAQGGYVRELRNGVSVTAGLSYYDYRNTRGFTPFYDGDGKGNTLDGSGNYAYDYDQVELFAEARLQLGAEPLRVFADYVTNTAADALDTGYAVGLAYRDASAPGDWQLGYAYEDIEADAVVATFTDSDFAGGGTDARGHVLEASYVLKNRLNLGLTYFLNDRGIAAGDDSDYSRLQLDLSFRY